MRDSCFSSGSTTLFVRRDSQGFEEGTHRECDEDGIRLVVIANFFFFYTRTRRKNEGKRGYSHFAG